MATDFAGLHGDDIPKAMIKGAQAAVEHFIATKGGIPPFAVLYVRRNPITKAPCKPMEVIMPVPPGIDFDTEHGKNVYSHLIRSLAEAADAGVVIFVSEAWMVFLSPKTPIDDARAMAGTLSKRPDRKEAISMTIDLEDGRQFSTHAFITRDGDSPSLGAWTAIDWTEGVSARHTEGRFAGFIQPKATA